MAIGEAVMEAEEHIEREYEEEEEEEEEAPSHLPFAPSSELCDTSTTIDPSYIISLIRQLLPRDTEKKKRTGDCNVEEGMPAMRATEDIDLPSDLNDGCVDNVDHLPIDLTESSSSNMDNGIHDEFGEQQRTGVSDNVQAEISEIYDPWEECGCILWDLSASKTHAEFMVDNLLLEVLLANLRISESLRVTEICLGIIGNVACHDCLSSVIVSKNGLIETVVQQLFLDDSTCLSETFRLISAGLQGNQYSSWAEALLPDQVLLRILWIIGNTLNPALLEKSIDLLLTIISNHEVSSILVQPLIKMGLPNLITSLLAGEMSKLDDENKLERSSVLDQVLGLVEALSSTDNYSNLMISNEELVPLLCGVVKLPDKLEVASSCASAVVIIANVLLDEQHLTLELSQDFSFLQGLLDILPFLSADLQARNAFWCIMARLLGRVQENDISFSMLQQFVSLFIDNSHLIEEDITSHAMQNSGECLDTLDVHMHDATANSLRRIACILEKWTFENSTVLAKGVADSNGENGSRLEQLLHICREHARLK